MMIKFRGNYLPLTYIFGSFFGVAMIAIIFAYNNYRYSKYKFIDFSEFLLYSKNEIFQPNSDDYRILIFSSNQINDNDILEKLGKGFPILAIDLLQKRGQSNSKLFHLSSDINTLLKIINIFGIKESPVYFNIKRQKNKIYKQNSSIKKIEG